MHSLEGYEYTLMKLDAIECDFENKLQMCTQPFGKKQLLFTKQNPRYEKYQVINSFKKQECTHQKFALSFVLGLLHSRSKDISRGYDASKTYAAISSSAKQLERLYYGPNVAERLRFVAGNAITSRICFHFEVNLYFYLSAIVLYLFFYRVSCSIQLCQAGFGT